MSSIVSVTQTAVLERLVLVGLNVNIWSARKKLHRDELDKDAKLPPEDMVSLGSKNCIDLSHLSVFDTLKRRAVRAIEKRGVRLMGAVGVPDTVHLEVVAELQEIEREFNAAKADFLSKYDSLCQEWISKSDKDQQWQEVLRRSITPKAYVEKGLNFNFTMCRIIPDETSASTSAGLVREIGGLSGQLYREIADEANDIMESMAGKEAVTQKTVNRLRGMHAKLVSLAFVNPDVQDFADYLQERLDALPKTGKLTDQSLRDLIGLVASLCDEHRIGTLAKAMATQAPVVQADEFGALMAASSDVVEEPAIVEDVAIAASAEVTSSVSEMPSAPVEFSPEQVIDLAQASVEICEVATSQQATVVTPDMQEPAPLEPQLPVTPSEPAVVGEEVDFCF